MTKGFQTLLLTVLGIILALMIYNLVFTHTQLKDTTQVIKGLKQDLNAVSDSISASKTRINTLVSHLDSSEIKMGLFRKQVDVLYLDYKKGQTKSVKVRDSLKNEMNDQEKQLLKLRNELKELE